MIPLDYFFHKFNRDNFRLIMTILVRDEVDIIETNIRTHANLGVDGFVIMDNGSTDGTREILTQLQSEFEIEIIDELGDYNQAKWMRNLAKVAKIQMGADWVINNDADEFWLPKDGKDGVMSLKEKLNFKGSVLTVQRYNMILDESLDNFTQARYYVKNPIFYSKETQLNSSSDVSIILTKIAPKTIVNPHGLLYLRGGNHKALHISNMRDYFRSGYDKIRRFEDIEVFHYPIRSYSQFEKNIRNRKRLLESGKKITMGPHYRRWVELYNLGKLEEEFYQKILFKQSDIETLLKYAILQKGDNIRLL